MVLISKGCWWVNVSVIKLSTFSLREINLYQKSVCLLKDNYIGAKVIEVFYLKFIRVETKKTKQFIFWTNSLIAN